MIPNFPDFIEINTVLRDEVYNFTSKFDPYSDFNFTSLYAYNVNKANTLSLLNENLVITLSDYNTGKPFFSFLGNNAIESTIETLLKFSKDNGLEARLKMVPEVSIQNVTNYQIDEDRDNFDYIYDVTDLSALKGSKHEKHRNLIKRFINICPNVRIKKLNLSLDSDKNEVLELFDLWASQSNKTQEETNTEKISISRIFDISGFNSFISLGVYDQDKLISFSIEEVLTTDYAIGHFGKYNKEYLGVNQFTEHAAADILMGLGIKYLNLEQDLGDEGLRLTKTLLRPTKFLKKYVIS